jgi:hypothetical protein
MNAPRSEDSRTDPQRPGEEAITESWKSDLDVIAHRLKCVFNEGHKTEATENPEAGCVPWYHFPNVQEKP